MNPQGHHGVEEGISDGLFGDTYKYGNLVGLEVFVVAEHHHLALTLGELTMINFSRWISRD
jgi:hypothetical protein